MFDDASDNIGDKKGKEAVDDKNKQNANVSPEVGSFKTRNIFITEKNSQFVPASEQGANLYGGKGRTIYKIDARSQSNICWFNILDYDLNNILFIHVNSENVKPIQSHGSFWDSKNRCYFYYFQYENIYIKVFNHTHSHSSLMNIVLLSDKIDSPLSSISLNKMKYNINSIWQYNPTNFTYSMVDSKAPIYIKKIQEKKDNDSQVVEKYGALKYKQNEIIQSEFFFKVTGEASVVNYGSVFVEGVEVQKNKGFFSSDYVLDNNKNSINLICEANLPLYYCEIVKNMRLDYQNIVDGYYLNLLLNFVVKNETMISNLSNPLYIVGESKQKEWVQVEKHDSQYKVQIDKSIIKGQLVFDFEASNIDSNIPKILMKAINSKTGNPLFDRSEKYMVTYFYANPHTISFGLSGTNDWTYQKSQILDKRQFWDQLSMKYINSPNNFCKEVDMIRKNLDNILIVEPFPASQNTPILRINIPQKR